MVQWCAAYSSGLSCDGCSFRITARWHAAARTAALVVSSCNGILLLAVRAVRAASLGDGVVPLALHAVLATQWRVVAAAPARRATAVLVAFTAQCYAAARPAVRVAPLRNGREAMAHRCGQPQARLCLSLHRAIACRRSQCLHANCMRCLSLNGVLPQASLAHTAARVTATARRGMTSHAVLLWARRCVLL